MEELHKYVPRKDDGSYHVVPCHGDGLSVERMTDSKRARAADLNPRDRLEGLEQTPQEFHHRGLMIQVTNIDRVGGEGWKAKYNCSVVLFLHVF
jgi:hypothetical protein